MNTELEYLIKKFLDGETTAREEQTLKRLLQDTGDDEYTEVKAFFSFTGSEKQKDEIPFDFREFTLGVVDNKIDLHKKSRITWFLQIAAVVVIFVATGLVLKNRLKPHERAIQYTMTVNCEGRIAKNSNGAKIVKIKLKQKFPNRFWTQQSDPICE